MNAAVLHASKIILSDLRHTSTDKQFNPRAINVPVFRKAVISASQSCVKLRAHVANFRKTGAFLHSNELFSSGTFIALTHLLLFPSRAGKGVEYRLLTLEELWVSITSRPNTTRVRPRLL